MHEFKKEMIMKKTWMYLAIMGITATSAQAKIIIDGGTFRCENGLQENVNLSVSFSIPADTEVKKTFYQKIEQINALAKQQNIGKFELQAKNYDIDTQNGTIIYALSPYYNAIKFTELLRQQKFQVSTKYTCSKPFIDVK